MRPRRARRRAFSAIEMVVVSLMMVVMSGILSSIWRGLCVPSLEAAARCRIGSEANFAAASFARDLSGHLPDAAGLSGGVNQGREVGREVTASGGLRICYHGGDTTATTPLWAAPDSVISYEWQGRLLVRTDEGAGTAVVVASDVTGFVVEPLADGSGQVITLTVAARGLSLVYELVAVNPPPP